MPSRLTCRALLCFSLAIQNAHSFKLTYYRGESCNGEQVGEIVLGPPPNGACSTEHSGDAESVLVSSTGAVDNGLAFVKFSSDDCNPDMEIGHGDDGDDGHNCIKGTFTAVQAWDLWNDIES